MPGGLIINAFAAKGDGFAADRSERVDLYWRRRDITVPLRVKILACGDRAKAQTAATLQDINTLRRAFKRTLHSIRRPYASEPSVFFLLLSLLRTAFTCSSVSFFDFCFFCLCRLTDARFHAGFWETVYDFTVVTRLLRNGRGAVRRSWRTARLDIYIILLLASEPRRCAPPPFLLRPNPLSPPTTSPPPTLSG